PRSFAIRSRSTDPITLPPPPPLPPWEEDPRYGKTFPPDPNNRDGRDTTTTTAAAAAAAAAAASAAVVDEQRTTGNNLTRHRPDPLAHTHTPTLLLASEGSLPSLTRFLYLPTPTLTHRNPGPHRGPAT